MTDRTNLSINLNKIALLRNARGANYPCLKDFALLCFKQDIAGLTLHPRPDHRHATSQDAIQLAQLCHHHGFEFNLEGNPFSEKLDDYLGFMELAKQINPHQLTLVPDSNTQITSDHGWNVKLDNSKKDKLIDTISECKKYSTRVSLFINIDKESVNFAKEVGADRVEFFTGPYANAFANLSYSYDLDNFQQCLVYANSLQLGINAGHDLNLENIIPLRKNGLLNLIDEVSIGHAIITESLLQGMEAVIAKYLTILDSNVRYKRSS